MAELTTYSVPPSFFEDHKNRSLPEEGSSELVGRKGRRVLVAMDEAGFRDLYSDAVYYSDPAIAADMGLFGLASSARATVKALAEQNPSLVELIRAENKAKGW